MYAASKGAAVAIKLLQEQKARDRGTRTPLVVAAASASDALRKSDLASIVFVRLV
jgi:hypothetical protein